LGPIGSAVLKFIGYKQTDKQKDKPNLYKDKPVLPLHSHDCAQVPNAPWLWQSFSGQLSTGADI